MDRLKNHINKRFISLFIIYVVISILIISSLLYLQASVDNFTRNSIPTKEALDHMLVDLYEDNIVLLEYLQTTNLTEAMDLDIRIVNHNAECRKVEEEVEALISSGVISNIQVEQFNSANTIHKEIEKLRLRIMEVHREEISKNYDLSTFKSNLLNEHSVLLKEASERFEFSIKSIEDENTLFLGRIRIQSRFIVIIFIFVTMIFAYFFFHAIKDLTENIAKPINNISNLADGYVEGKRNYHFKSSSNIKEISSLESNMLKLFNALNLISNSDVSMKSEIDSFLLPKDNVELINYIKVQNDQNRQVTIKDLKKYLNVTHPTILQKINSLSNMDFIAITKVGREKVITLKPKSNKVLKT